METVREKVPPFLSHQIPGGPPVSFDGIPPLISRILWARGLQTPDMVQNFLSPTLKDLRDPRSILNMRIAVDRLVKAFESREKVAIYADFDLDGTTGLALLTLGLERLGFQNLVAYQPARLTEGYGLHAAAVEDLAKIGVRVIITVDVGITGFAAGEKACELGIDLIITDHHLSHSQLPKAYTIVNPNQPEDTSDLGHLSGAGVAFYLILALRKAFGEQSLGSLNWDPKELLDCFAIGTLTDMVPLRDENRVLVKHGLIQLTKSKRPGIRALIRALDLENRTLYSKDVGFGIAPCLNALSRMELGLRPIDILVVPEETRAKELSEEILKVNKLRKDIQKSVELHAKERAQSVAHRGFLFLHSENYHKGVIGLVATRLCQQYKVPTFIGKLDGDKIFCSARNPDGYPIGLVEILGAVSKHVLQFGGHAQAAGFSLNLSQAGDLDLALEMYFSALKFEANLKVSYDTEANLEELDSDFQKWYDSLEPFGKGFPTPLILFKNLPKVSISELTGGHLRYKFSGRNGITGVQFSPPPKTKLAVQNSKIPNRLIAEFQWNTYMGTRRPQLLIHDIEFEHDDPSS